jgi:hypothetical protein
MSATSSVRHSALLDGLAELGYADGQTIAIEYRYAAGMSM